MPFGDILLPVIWESTWLTIVGGLVMSYVTGLVLESMNESLLDRAMSGKYTKHGATVQTSVKSWRKPFDVLRVLFAIPAPPVEEVMSERLRIFEDLEHVLKGADEAAITFQGLSPYDFLEIYRTVKAHDSVVCSSPIFQQATEVHRQVRLSLGMWLTFALVASHTVVFGILNVIQHWGHARCFLLLNVLIVWIVGARFVAGRLSKVAKRRWIIEHHMTACLMVLYGHQDR